MNWIELTKLEDEGKVWVNAANIAYMELGGVSSIHTKIFFNNDDSINVMEPPHTIINQPK